MFIKVMVSRILSIISVGCIVMSAAQASPAPSSIPLKSCPSFENNAPFFCLTVGGAALKQPKDVRLDTGGNVFIIPKDCLAPGSYQVVPGQPQSVNDPWGNPSQVVQADISLMNGDQVVATLKNFQFLAGTESKCDDPNAFSNFGAGFDFYTYFPTDGALQQSPSKKTSQTKKGRSNTPEPMISPSHSSMRSQSQQGLPRDTARWDSCLGSFFTFYTMQQNTAASQAYGFETRYINSALSLAVGPLDTKNNKNSQVFQFAPQTPRACGGFDNVIEYLGVTGNQWTGPTIGNFFLSIAGMPTASAQMHSKKMPQDNDNGWIVMVDSGGGMLIVSDDANMSLSQQLVSSGKATACPGQSIGWLANCVCVNSGLPITVSSASNPVISYSYTTTDVAQDERQAVAVCPMWQPGSPNPYISPGGFNAGGQLFRNLNILFDFKGGSVSLVKPE